MKRCLAILVLVCLLTSGCGVKGEEKTESAEDAVLLTVDGRAVPLWRYRCWLNHACSQTEERYAAAGQSVNWDAETEGKSLTETVKEQALADTVLYATVENQAERYGCTVSAEEVPSGAELPLTGLNEVQERELLAVGRMYAALYELYCTEGSELAPTEEELSAFEVESGSMVLDRILISAGADREAARQRAAEVFSRLNGAEEPAAVFAALAAEGDDRFGPRRADESGWDESLLEAARSLAAGQYSGILENDEGFFILLRQAADREELREAHFDSLLQAAAEGAEVVLEPQYEELCP